MYQIVPGSADVVLRKFKRLQMKTIKVLGSGCTKCKITYNNAVEAAKQLGVEVQIEKVEDIEEILKYNVLTTPVLMIDDEAKIKGRIAEVDEIVALLKN